jgi:hypothetical protein
MHAKKLISACTNSASGTHRALVGARSKCHLHIEQPAGLAQHADTPSAQVQTLRASRSMRACCGLHAGVSACCAKSRTQAKRHLRSRDAPIARASQMRHASEARPVRTRCRRVSIAASARGRYWRARLSLPRQRPPATGTHATRSPLCLHLRAGGVRMLR